MSARAPRLALAGGTPPNGGGGPPRISPQLAAAIRSLQMSRRELIEAIRAELGRIEGASHGDGDEPAGV